MDPEKQLEKILNKQFNVNYEELTKSYNTNYIWIIIIIIIIIGIILYKNNQDKQKILD
jgi:hypothetical protein